MEAAPGVNDLIVMRRSRQRIDTLALADRSGRNGPMNEAAFHFDAVRARGELYNKP
jgi:hypothetical protein